MRKVVIATPCHDQRVDAWYHHSVIETILVGRQVGIEFRPLSLPGEALVQHARNQLARDFLAGDAEAILWIDSDQEWQAQDAIRLVRHDVQVVGAPYCKRQDALCYNVYCQNWPPKVGPATGLWRVDGLGTGFLKVSRQVMQAVWDASDPYTKNGKEYRMAFEVGIMDGQLCAEDMAFCLKVRESGCTVYLDPAIEIGHNGYKRYRGSFQAWCEAVGKKRAEKAVNDELAALAPAVGRHDESNAY